MTMLIGVAGKAGSGKDTVAEHLFFQHGFCKIAFADALRKACGAMFGFSAVQMSDREMKEAVDPYWGLSPRRALQLLGNDAVKPVFGNDVWVKRWLMDYNLIRDTDHVVVSDVRFDLEADLIREQGGVIIHLERPGAGLSGEAGQHSSEAGVRFLEGDLLLLNNGNLTDLFDKLDALMVTLNAS